jgi:hypothetical protein
MYNQHQQQIKAKRLETVFSAAAAAAGAQRVPMTPSGSKAPCSATVGSQNPAMPATTAVTLNGQTYVK